MFLVPCRCCFEVPNLAILAQGGGARKQRGMKSIHILQAVSQLLIEDPQSKTGFDCQWLSHHAVISLPRTSPGPRWTMRACVFQTRVLHNGDRNAWKVQTMMFLCDCPSRGCTEMYWCSMRHEGLWRIEPYRQKKHEKTDEWTEFFVGGASRNPWIAVTALCGSLLEPEACTCVFSWAAPEFPRPLWIWAPAKETNNNQKVVLAHEWWQALLSPTVSQPLYSALSHTTLSYSLSYSMYSRLRSRPIRL